MENLEIGQRRTVYSVYFFYEGRLTMAQGLLDRYKTYRKAEHAIEKARNSNEAAVASSWLRKGMEPQIVREDYKRMK